MQISKVIKELEGIRERCGEVRVCLQSTPTDENGPIYTYESLFIHQEEHSGPSSGYKYLRDTVHILETGAVEEYGGPEYPRETVVNFRLWWM